MAIPRRWGVLVAAVAVVAAGTAGAVAVTRGQPGGGPAQPSASRAAAAPSASSSAASTAGSPARTPLVPVPRRGAATQASIGDPLFPGLGNGGYDVQAYDLRVTYPRADPRQSVTLAVTIRARATQRLTAFDLDYGGAGLGAVTVDGAPARVLRRGQELVVTPASPVRAGHAFTVAIGGVRATPVAVRPGVAGTAPFLSSRDGTVLAGQPNGMHEVFPCNDHPSDKALFTFTLDVPAGWTAVANGVAAGRVDSGGRTVWRYRESHPLATELVQIAAGDLRVAQLPAVGAVQRRDVVPTRLAGSLLPALAPVSGYVTWMQGQVGPYPFETYGGLVVEGELGFSLETQTLSIFDTGVLGSPSAPQRERVLVHELAHQWFGDSVAPAIWSDVWLNEGHATWYQLTYAAEHGSLGPLTNGAVTTLDGYMRRVYAVADELRARFGPPGAPTSGGQGPGQGLFNPDVYDGGALVLYALRQEIGADAFTQVERRWVVVHRDGVASSADFVALASRVAGRDLGPFLDAWLYGRTVPPMPGHPDWTTTPATSRGT
jgi:aminopeptidase N